jgi:hypothetical protein
VDRFPGCREFGLVFWTILAADYLSVKVWTSTFLPNSTGSHPLNWCLSSMAWVIFAGYWLNLISYRLPCQRLAVVAVGSTGTQ